VAGRGDSSMRENDSQQTGSGAGFPRARAACGRRPPDPPATAFVPRQPLIRPIIVSV
jgi:hypothetical protein